MSLPLVKGIVHPKMKILSFTHHMMSFQTCMLFFLPWYTKEDILKKISAVFVCTTKEVQKHWTPLSFIVKEKDIEREKERDFKIPPFVSQ